MFNNVNVQELLDTYGIDYKPSSTSFKTYCFFHDEKNPSLFINKEQGFFHCFSCGIRGSYADLYKIITGQTYTYSSLDSWLYNPLKKRVYKEKEVKQDIDIKIFGTLLNPLENKEIREWLRKYGIEDDSFIEKYGIKYSTYTEMIEKNLMDNPEVEYTKMVDRIIIPIYNESNKIINYEGRTYKGIQPKVLYVRGASTETLYNFNNIDIDKPVVVVEGIKAFWRVYNVFQNTVCMMHNIPTDYQMNLLNSIKGELIFFLDNDAGGWGEEKNHKFRKGTIQYIEEGINKSFKICYADIKGYDPNDLDCPTIKRKIDNAIDYTRFKIDKLFVNSEERKNQW